MNSIICDSCLYEKSLNALRVIATLFARFKSINLAISLLPGPDLAAFFFFSSSLSGFFWNSSTCFDISIAGPGCFAPVSLAVFVFDQTLPAMDTSSAIGLQWNPALKPPRFFWVAAFPGTFVLLSPSTAAIIFSDTPSLFILWRTASFGILILSILRYVAAVDSSFAVNEDAAFLDAAGTPSTNAMIFESTPSFFILCATASFGIHILSIFLYVWAAACSDKVRFIEAGASGFDVVGWSSSLSPTSQAPSTPNTADTIFWFTPSFFILWPTASRGILIFNIFRYVEAILSSSGERLLISEDDGGADAAALPLFGKVSPRTNSIILWSTWSSSILRLTSFLEAFIIFSINWYLNAVFDASGDKADSAQDTSDRGLDGASALTTLIGFVVTEGAFRAGRFLERSSFVKSLAFKIPFLPSSSWWSFFRWRNSSRTFCSSSLSCSTYTESLLPAVLFSLILARLMPLLPFVFGGVSLISWRALANRIHCAEVGKHRSWWTLSSDATITFTWNDDISSNADFTSPRSMRHITFALVVVCPGIDWTFVIPFLPTITCISTSVPDLASLTRGTIISFKSKSIDGDISIGLLSPPVDGTNLIGFSSPPFDGAKLIGFPSVPLIGDNLMGLFSEPRVSINLIGCPSALPAFAMSIGFLSVPETSVTDDVVVLRDMSKFFFGPPPAEPFVGVFFKTIRWNSAVSVTVSAWESFLCWSVFTTGRSRTFVQDLGIGSSSFWLSENDRDRSLTLVKGTDSPDVGGSLNIDDVLPSFVFFVSKYLESFEESKLPEGTGIATEFRICWSKVTS